MAELKLGDGWAYPCYNAPEEMHDASKAMSTPESLVLGSHACGSGDPVCLLWDYE
jgi:hypothetical protein